MIENLGLRLSEGPEKKFELIGSFYREYVAVPAHIKHYNQQDFQQMNYQISSNLF